MNSFEYKSSPDEIARWCVNRYWPIRRGGWDKGSLAHKCAIRWAKNNFKYLKTLTRDKIYKEYLKTLVQE